MAIAVWDGMEYKGGAGLPKNNRTSKCVIFLLVLSSAGGIEGAQ